MTDALQDPYEVLGVDLEASADDIRTAYRKKAQAMHPDKAPGDPDAVRAFQELNEAYQTLADPSKRAKYDDTGSLEDSPETECRNAAIKTLTDMFMAFVNREDISPEADFRLAMRLQTESVIESNRAAILEAEKTIKVRHKIARKWRNRRGARNIFDNAIRRNILALRAQIKQCKVAIELGEECLLVLKDYDFGATLLDQQLRRLP